MLANAEPISVGEIRVAVRRAPGEGRPVLLLHGLTDSGACFSRLAAHLAPERGCVALDLRGHGLSDAPESGYTSGELAADVVGAVEALEMDRVTLLGHSLGADVAFHAALLRPDLFLQVILEDPPWASSWTPGRPPELQRMHDDWRGNLEKLQSMSYEEVLAHGRTQTPHWVDEELQPWARSKLQVSIRALGYITSIRPAWKPLLGQLECPMLLVTGEPSCGGMVSPSTAQEARSLSPTLEVLHILGAGHSVHRDQFEPYLEGVRRFLGLSPVR